MHVGEGIEGVVSGCTRGCRGEGEGRRVESISCLISTIAR